MSRGRGRASALVRASHPEPTAAVTGLMTALAHSAGAPAGRVGLALLAGQLTTGWSNDWIDRDRDRRSARGDKPLVQGVLPAAAIGGAALLAGALSVPLSLRLGRRAGLLHLAAVGSALSYNAALKGTALSFLPYALSFGALPSVVVLATPGGGRAPAWATAGGALLGVGAHLANALPDLEDDLATGVRGLPHRLGRGRSTALMAALLLAATGELALGPAGWPPVLQRREGLALVVAGGLAATGAGLAHRNPRSRAAFLASLAIAGVDVALLLSQGELLSAGHGPGSPAVRAGGPAGTIGA